MNMLDYINWYPDLLMILLIDLVIAIALMTSLRFIAGLIGEVSTTEELSQRDNPAFGISIAGSIGAVAMVMSGAISGNPGKTFLNEIILVLSYGLLGMFLLVLSRYIFDKISMPQVSIRDEIMKGNVAAGLVNAGNTVATGVIIRAVMIWVDSNSLNGLEAVLIGYVTSQVVLSLATFYQAKVYASRNQGRSIQEALREGNTALALRFFGHRVGVALSVTAASGFIPYSGDGLVLRCLLWGGVALAMLLVLPLLAVIARKVILAKINVVEEVDEQRNLGVGAIEAVIYMTVGYLLASLIA